MKNKIVSMLLAISIIACLFLAPTFTANAETISGKCGKSATWQYNISTNLLTISGKGNMTDFETDYDELSNIVAKTPWKDFKEAIKSVTIKSGITSIGAYAFYNCFQLESVSISNTVKSINNTAFNNCLALKSVTIPSSVTTIKHSAFLGCTALKSVTMSSGLKSIDNGAFSSCISLSSVKLPSGLTSLGYNVFSGCSSLKSITIPDSVTTIGFETFLNTAWYNSKPNGVIYAGKIAYTYKGTMPKNTNLKLKSGTLIINDSAFSYSEGLKSIVIPNTVKTIGDSAFSGCNSLESITIPDSVKSIGYYAFSSCGALKSVKLGKGVSKISSGMFNGCEKLSSITLPNNVKKIGEFAFSYSNISNVNFGNSVTDIEYGAFSSCNSLKSIKLPKSVKKINTNVFFGSENFEKITVESGNSTYTAKGNCLIKKSSKELVAGTKNSVIPTDGSVTKIGKAAFRGYSKLKSIKIPKGVTTIGDYAFLQCENLKTVKIADSVTTIGLAPFSDTAWMNDRRDGLVYAGKVVYSYNGPMPDNAKIVIKNGTVGIADSAFAYYTNLKSITIPKSMKVINKSAFQSCENLKTVYYKGSKTQKGKIKIAANNQSLKNAAWKYGTEITLTKTSYIYDGKAKKPGVTVKDASGNALKNKTDYTVSYANNRKSIGKYGVTVTIKNKNYFGSKTVYFTINPKSTSLLKVATPKAKQIKVTWKKKINNTDGYQIQYSTVKRFKSGNKTVTITKNSKTTETLKNLKSNKTYYVRIRTFKTVGKKKYYSDWSKVRSIKTK